MKIAYFDTFSGISGDMIIGAFINTGFPLVILEEELKKLNLSGYSISQRLVQKNSIAATQFEVHTQHDHNSHHSHNHTRSLSEIVSLIYGSSLERRIKEKSVKIFNVIGKAEAKIHNVPIEKVHFHEIGAVDSIIDIVGYAICVDQLRIDRIYSNIIPLGKGFVETQHGTMPIPAPATIEILKNYPVRFSDLSYELTTPTGAAIIVAESVGILGSKKLTVEKIGYGAGTKDIPKIPNLLRILIGEIMEDYDTDECFMIETNIDDMNPEFYPFVLEKLFDAGIHDAHLTPIIMKKGRPGVMLSSLCDSNKIDEVLKIIYRETSTLGVRILRVDRRKLLREIKTIKTKFGEVQVKIVESEGNKKIIPEFEECKRIALQKNIPISEVYNEILKHNTLSG